MKVALAFPVKYRKDVPEIKELLEGFGIEVLPFEENIQLEGRTINIGAFEQLKARDGRNPYIVKMKSEIMKLEIAKISKADGVLLYNINSYIDPMMFFNATIAWLTAKKIYLYDILNTSTSFFDELRAMNPIYLNRNLESIVDNREILLKTIVEEVIKLEAKVEEEQPKPKVERIPLKTIQRVQLKIKKS